MSLASFDRESCVKQDRPPMLDGVLWSLSLAAIAFGATLLFCGAAIAIRAIFDDGWPVHLIVGMLGIGGAFTIGGVLVQMHLHHLARRYEERPGFRVKLITGESPVADTERETTNG